jgi:hypothetical protein
VGDFFGFRAYFCMVSWIFFVVIILIIFTTVIVWIVSNVVNSGIISRCMFFIVSGRELTKFEKGESELFLQPIANLIFYNFFFFHCVSIGDNRIKLYGKDIMAPKKYNNIKELLK